MSDELKNKATKTYLAIKKIVESSGSIDVNDFGTDYGPPIFLQVRGIWQCAFSDMVATDYDLRMYAGNTQMRIIGGLDEDFKPFTAWLQYQISTYNWGTVYDAEDKILLSYIKPFIYRD